MDHTPQPSSEAVQPPPSTKLGYNLRNTVQRQSRNAPTGPAPAPAPAPAINRSKSRKRKAKGNKKIAKIPTKPTASLSKRKRNDHEDEDGSVTGAQPGAANRKNKHPRLDTVTKDKENREDEDKLTPRGQRAKEREKRAAERALRCNTVTPTAPIPEEDHQQAPPPQSLSARDKGKGRQVPTGNQAEDSHQQEPAATGADPASSSTAKIGPSSSRVAFGFSSFASLSALPSSDLPSPAVPIPTTQPGPSSPKTGSSGFLPGPSSLRTAFGIPSGFPSASANFLSPAVPTSTAQPGPSSPRAGSFGFLPGPSSPRTTFGVPAIFPSASAISPSPVAPISTAQPGPSSPRTASFGFLPGPSSPRTTFGVPASFPSASAISPSPVGLTSTAQPGPSSPRAGSSGFPSAFASGSAVSPFAMVARAASSSASIFASGSHPGFQPAAQAAGLVPLPERVAAREAREAAEQAIARAAELPDRRRVLTPEQRTRFLAMARAKGGPDSYQTEADREALFAAIIRTHPGLAVWDDELESE